MTQEHQEASGIHVQDNPAQLAPRPPIDADGPTIAGGVGEDPKEKKPGQKKVPLPASVVKFPLLTGSRAIADITEYPRFAFTQEEADTLSQAIADLGMEFTPAINVLLLAVGIVAGKGMGYAMWLKSGKPPLAADGTPQPRPQPQAQPQPDHTPDIGELSAALSDGPADSGTSEYDG
jgi:hypothetical protein